LLIEFICMLDSRNIVLYIYIYSRERKPDCVWYFNPPKSYRITETDITDFVNCVKECVFISVFNKAHFEEAAKACQCLSQLRPELIVPPLVELFVFCPSFCLIINHLTDF
jgi:hypothetical protein